MCRVLTDFHRIQSKHNFHLVFGAFHERKSYFQILSHTFCHPSITTYHFHPHPNSIQHRRRQILFWNDRISILFPLSINNQQKQQQKKKKKLKSSSKINQFILTKFCFLFISSLLSFSVSNFSVAEQVCGLCWVHICRNLMTKKKDESQTNIIHYRQSETLVQSNIEHFIISLAESSPQVAEQTFGIGIGEEDE